jgi:NAD(P)-dependent dehydrogenase (short-subunit alcohol dehydrogenase family)
MKALSGLAAIVTGGGSGLGAATARLLAAQGMRVALFDVNRQMAQAVADEIGGLALVCDVTSEGAVEGALQAAAAAHGPARVAVNCAGIAPPAKILGREGPHDLVLFEKVIAINLVGTFNVLRLASAAMAALPPLEEDGDGERGVIINTASVAAFEGQIGQAAYAASKGAVHALTLPAARELARYGIRVVSIAPGLFLTPMMLGLPREAQESLGKQVPFPSRLGDPGEYAELALHIVRNRMLNGETIRLDGAIRMAAK